MIGAIKADHFNYKSFIVNSFLDLLSNFILFLSHYTLLNVAWLMKSICSSFCNTMSELSLLLPQCNFTLTVSAAKISAGLAL